MKTKVSVGNGSSSVSFEHEPAAWYSVTTTTTTYAPQEGTDGPEADPELELKTQLKTVIAGLEKEKANLQQEIANRQQEIADLRAQYERLKVVFRSGI